MYSIIPTIFPGTSLQQFSKSGEGLEDEVERYLRSGNFFLFGKGGRVCLQVTLTYPFLSYFFVKKIPLSRRVGYVMGGSVSGSVNGSVSVSVRDVCMSHQSD